MRQVETEAVVIGAGPAGVAVARQLHAAGLDVTVIDPGLPPAPRIESLPANGLALAESLGLDAALTAACLGRAHGIRMHWRASAELRAFQDDPPLLLDRARLHHALRGAVSDLRVITARGRQIAPSGDRPRVQAGDCIVAARVIVDARGRAGLRAPRRSGADLVALSFAGRLDAASAAAMMQIEALEDGWLWACTLPDGRLSGQLFLDATALAGLGRPAQKALLARRLAATYPGVEPMAGRVAPAMLEAVDDPFAGDFVLRIGDAALARDPIASHGLLHALRSGAQAAAAVTTLLDPDGDAAAARAFIRDRHHRAAEAALTATAQAYGDQARLRSPFWQMRAPAPLPPPRTQPWPPLSRPLTLATPVRKVAMLDAGRIRWTPAIWLATSAEAVPRLGPLCATTLAGLLTPPAPLTELSGRLDRAVGPAASQAILRRLLDEGALAPAGQAGERPDARSA